VYNLFKITVNEGKLFGVCIDVNLFDEKVKSKMNAFPSLEESNTLKVEFYELSLRYSLLKNIMENIKLDSNRAYILKISMGSENYVFNLANIVGMKENNGYTISKTLLV